MFVYPRFIEPDRGALTVAVDGPPVFIVEVLSESTYEADLDLVRGKGYSDARAGVQEYLALDPPEAFLPERGQAWHLVDGLYRPWEPNATGRWHSAEVGVAIGREGTLATVYTREGKRLLHEGEVEEELARRDETIPHQAAQIEELRRLVRELRGEQ